MDISAKDWLYSALGPTEVCFEMVNGNEYAILRADTFRTAMRERDELRAEVERLRARLDAAERVIEVVRARQIGTAGGVGAAFATYDEVVGRK